MAATLHTSGKVDWWRSLRTRLVFWSSLGSVLLMIAVAALFYLAVRAALLDNARTEMHGLARQTALGLQATLESVQVAARGLAFGAHRLAADPQDLRSLLLSAVEADPNIAGAMLILESGKLSDGHRGYSHYVRRSAEGLHESSVEDLGYDYRAMPWYVRTAGSGEAWWSEPYANAATGHELFVTYNLPLRGAPSVDSPSGDVIGMVSLDVPLARLRAQIGELPASAGLRPVLLSPQRLYVEHWDPGVRMLTTLDQVVAGGRSDLAPYLQAVRERRSVELEHRPATALGAEVAGETRYTFAAPVADTGWTFGLSVSRDYLLGPLNRIAVWVVLVGVAGVVAGMVAVRRTSAMVAQPIEDLTESARQFGEGQFDAPMRHVERVDEVGVLARVIDGARASIKRQLVEITEMGAARERADSELRIASGIQQAMLPANDAFAAGGWRLEVAGLLEPAKSVGGDFFDFFVREGDVLWFVIGDVSDKGVPAALFMARTMTVLEVAAHFGHPPDRALRAAARFLENGNDTCMFATVLCGTIALRTGEFSLASAAHEPPVLLRADGSRAFLPVPTAAPLGIEVAAEYPVWSGRLLPGDSLLAYTDGVTEEFRGEEAFGAARLLAALDPTADADRQAHALVTAVRAFAAGTAQSDDITVLAIRWLPQPGPA